MNVWSFECCVVVDSIAADYQNNTIMVQKQTTEALKKPTLSFTR
jgi:hypothetical protein